MYYVLIILTYYFGLTLNKDKCVINSSSLTYIGHELSSEEVKPDTMKLKAISEMPAPTERKGVMRLLGTVNYLSRFTPNMSQVIEPIRLLLRHDIEVKWNYEQETAFNQIKEILTSNPVQKYFDVSKPVTVQCDASKSGLGAVLHQENQPVAYATDTETEYAQIEKELLSTVLALEIFNQYTFGKQVMVESDHKPLETIVKKPLVNAPPRLQRMLLRLQKYNFVIQYKPGTLMYISDMFSRGYVHENQDKQLEEEIQCHVHLVVKNLPYLDEQLRMAVH